MKHREFITADFAGLTEVERSEGSILLGGSATEHVVAPRGVNTEVAAVFDAMEISEAEWRDPRMQLTAVFRVGDREAPEILAELDRLRAGTGSEAILPYVVTFVMGSNLVEGVESPALSASAILEIEGQSLEERRAEARAWIEEHGPAPELSDIPPDEAGLSDLPWREDTARYLQQKQLEQMQPVRALVLPWDEPTAERYYIHNTSGELDQRRQPFFIVGKRVFTVGVGLHLNIQPE